MLKIRNILLESGAQLTSSCFNTFNQICVCLLNKSFRLQNYLMSDTIDGQHI